MVLHRPVEPARAIRTDPLAPSGTRSQSGHEVLLRTAGAGTSSISCNDTSADCVRVLSLPGRPVMKAILLHEHGGTCALHQTDEPPLRHNEALLQVPRCVWLSDSFPFRTPHIMGDRPAMRVPAAEGCNTFSWKALGIARGRCRKPVGNPDHRCKSGRRLLRRLALRCGYSKILDPIPQNLSLTLCSLWPVSYS